MNPNKTLSTLTRLSTLAALAALTACGAADADEPFAETENQPVGGVNAPPSAGVNDDSQPSEDVDAPEEPDLPEVCPEDPPLPEALAETFHSPRAERLCDLESSPDAFVWHLGFAGRAVVSEDLGDGRFRFTADGGEFHNYQYNPDCDARGPRLELGGLGTTGLAVGDAVRLDLAEGEPAPEDGFAYESGWVSLEATGELLAAWGGPAGGYALRDGGPVLEVSSGDVICGERNVDAQCSWSEVRHHAAVLRLGDDTATFFGGVHEVVLGGETYLVAAANTSITYNYDCDPDIADASPVNASPHSLMIVRWVR
jgi:hypothetical protein